MKATGIALLLSTLAVHGDILSETHAPFSPGDSDLGVQMILKPAPEKTPIDFTLGFDLHYTDNAPAEPGSQQESSALLSTRLGVFWLPPIANGWFADVGIVQEFHEFDHGDALDFENTLTHIGVIKNIVALDDTVFYARHEMQRITTGSAGDSDYIANRIRTGLNKTFYLDARHQLTAGISAAFDINAGPDSLERDEYAIDLSYTYQMTNKLSATLMASTAIWNFAQGGREDDVHGLGAELSYALTENSEITAGIYYSSNDTDTAFAGSDSKSWQGGLSFNFNHSF